MKRRTAQGEDPQPDLRTSHTVSKVPMVNVQKPSYGIDSRVRKQARKPAVYILQ